MNLLEFVEIEGFWGTKTVRIPFHDDLNFLIGPNGSGKTTVINLIAAVLQADIESLYSIQFQKITIRLKAIGSNRKPVIEVSKQIDKEMGHLELAYSIRSKTSDQPAFYVVEGPYDDRLYHPRNVRTRKAGESLSVMLAEVVEVNWLSIHRGEKQNRRTRDETFDTRIDKKIFDIGQKFSSYFSLLSSKANQETKFFQEHVFLSLLEQDRTSTEVFSQIEIEPEEKNSVIDVLQSLGVSETKSRKSVNAHYKRLQEAKKNYQETQSLRIDDAVSLSDAHRVHEMLEKWRKLNSKKDAIFHPRTEFNSIINSMLTGKKLVFDKRNNPVIQSIEGGEFDTRILSSGEKQLFILLGEALLQEEKPVVFISDEPELSLHVTWQSVLFENIRKLNQNSQVISATHSPDIVGKFQEKVIEVADCIFDV